MTNRKLETLEDTLATAVNIYFNDDLESDKVVNELEALVAAARKNGVDITQDDTIDRIEERKDAEQEAVSYSWVHLNEFRLFELHNQCFPWSTPEELRTVVEKIP